MLDLVTATEALTVGAWQFVTILLLIFGLFLILAGLFTAYFGSGKSRTIGVVLLVVGIVVGILISYSYSRVLDHALTALVWEAFLVIIAAVIGALAAIAIFLVAIMKS
ncbi:MAG: hypothetical protein L3K19_03960 [Thermoplasmata archaeon]|nr:hypothetical protein [Thermoplasmata archaeon]